MPNITSNITDHPFKPGARVAISNRHADGYKEGFVDKLHKTGRFTLRGSQQQYKAYPNSFGDKSDKVWRAMSSGNGWSYTYLIIWDETTEAEIAASNEKAALKQRWKGIVDAVFSFHYDKVTVAMCDAIEAALPKKEG